MYDYIKCNHHGSNNVKCLFLSKEYKSKKTLTVHLDNVHKRKVKTPAVYEISDNLCRINNNWKCIFWFIQPVKDISNVMFKMQCLTRCGLLTSTWCASWSGLKALVCPVEANVLLVTNLQGVPVVTARMRWDGVFSVFSACSCLFWYCHLQNWFWLFFPI